jgi:hypothetical protein
LNSLKITSHHLLRFLELSSEGFVEFLLGSSRIPLGLGELGFFLGEE